MKNITVHLPQRQLDKMDDLILRELFSNRSEFVRAAIRGLILRHSYLLTEFPEESNNTP
ncbi:MAG: ribbon-helix-helix domain-containing protein [Candidatus Hodarchaeales archaeon]|jgi:Arc/MetJ-type ribon-helix-helix transcriptional regulator